MGSLSASPFFLVSFCPIDCLDPESRRVWESVSCSFGLNVAQTQSDEPVSPHRVANPAASGLAASSKWWCGVPTQRHPESENLGANRRSSSAPRGVSRRRRHTTSERPGRATSPISRQGVFLRENIGMVTRFLKIVILAGTIAAASNLPAQPPQGSHLDPDENLCATCHGEADLWDEDKRRLYISSESLARDVHFLKGVNCHDCHGGNPTSFDVPEAHSTEVTEEGAEWRPFQSP